MTKVKDTKPIAAKVPTETYDKIVAYANSHTQGNLSYAIRLAIDLLLEESAKVKIGSK